MMLFSIDKNSEIPLFIQIRNQLKAAIEDGVLKAGYRFPSVSELSSEAGVTAATVRRAFQDLSDWRMIESFVGRGTFVADLRPRNDTRTREESTAHSETVSTARRLRMGITKNLSDLLTMAQKPGVISFTRGVGDSETLEEGVLTDLVKKALAKGESDYWDYGDPRGLPGLREAVASLYRERGLSVNADQILITSGSQQAVALLAQEAGESGWRVLCETPCYMGVPNAFGAFGHWVETIPRDTEGPLPDRLNYFQDNITSLLYICPVLHNPMGTDISPERREMVAQWARDNSSYILSDEVNRDLRIDGEEPLSFLSGSDPDRAIVLGSLSKSFMGGLRVGWLAASGERVRSLAQLKKAMDIACPPLMQGAALSLLTGDYFPSHIGKIRAHYKTRRDICLESLNEYMPSSVRWTVPRGGIQLWVTLPEGYSSVALYLKAVENGAAFLPGPLQDISNRFVNSFRLCYGSLEPDDVREGIKRIADAAGELLSAPPGRSDLNGLGDYI